MIKTLQVPETCKVFLFHKVAIVIVWYNRKKTLIIRFCSAIITSHSATDDNLFFCFTNWMSPLVFTLSLAIFQFIFLVCLFLLTVIIHTDQMYCLTDKPYFCSKPN